MESPKLFEAILYEELLPTFCSHPNGQYQATAFRRESVCISEVDAFDFVRAWQAGLITPTEKPWLYRCAKSKASEQFFWSGAKQPPPQKITLWLEPVITVAALARLHFDFGWPSDLLGTQAPGFAFDLLCCKPNTDTEVVLGEVKKSTKEVDQLIEYMHKFGRDPSAATPINAKEQNAYNKVAALREATAPILWVVGPKRYSKAFRVKRAGKKIDLTSAPESVLLFANYVGPDPPQRNAVPS
ncbi:MAG TPA: hypothetical protein VFK50_05390 [Sphingomicrobium sp.]|nr:hypothetical protein [Sphingomicrobium sp.]